MPADRNYDDDCQLPSCHLPQDRSTWLIRYGLHLGPKQWAAWRGPSNYHVWPPTAQLSGGDDQRWLGTRFLTGPQDFQSLGASVCFPMFLLYSNKYSKKPLFSTTPIQFIQWTTLPSLSRRWFSLNNYCACNKWFVWLCCNCLCECMLSRKKEDAKKFWLCIGQHMWISEREVHVFKMLCVYVCAWNLKCVDDVLCVSWARLRGGIFCWPYQPCCTKLLNTLYKNVFSFVFYFFAPLDLCVVIYNSLYWNKIMTNVIYFVAAVTVILCERQMHFFFNTQSRFFLIYQNYQFTPDYLRNKQTIAQLKVAIFTGVWLEHERCPTVDYIIVCVVHRLASLVFWSQGTWMSVWEPTWTLECFQVFSACVSVCACVCVLTQGLVMRPVAI